MSELVHVAVGVVIGQDGCILIARRPHNAHQGGLWEFPGGKVAAGESLLEALSRELHEELSIRVESTQPLIKIRHDYGDKLVLLDVHKVTSFSGVPRGNEGQPIAWVNESDLVNYAFPAANRAIVTALLLPEKMLITGSASSSEEFMQRAEAALESEIRLIQLRCPDMPPDEYQKLAKSMGKLCSAYDAWLLLNTAPQNFPSISSVGLHVNRHHLRGLAARPVGTQIMFGASCHNEEEIVQACGIGVDYITLSPVASTPSHPGADALGWDEFARLAAMANVPVYALGGLSDIDLISAKASGAQGIAAISCWWNT